MQIQLLAFARARDLVGQAEQVVETTPGETPRQLVARISPPATAELNGWRVAVNREYRRWDEPLGEGVEEVALIPPVSGG